MGLLVAGTGLLIPIFAIASYFAANEINRYFIIQSEARFILMLTLFTGLAFLLGRAAKASSWFDGDFLFIDVEYWGYTGALILLMYVGLRLLGFEIDLGPFAIK